MEVAESIHDGDLKAAIEYNNPGGDEVVTEILATVEGENDGADWHWLTKLTDGRFAYITGSCDFTGWDCQSNAIVKIHKTLEATLASVPATDDYNRKVRQLLRAGLKHKNAEDNK